MEEDAEIEVLNCFVGAAVLHVAVFFIDQLLPGRPQDLGCGVPVGCWGCVSDSSEFEWGRMEKKG